MSNQKTSQEELASAGNTIGPVEQCWQQLQTQVDFGDDESRAHGKRIFYSAMVQSYNLFVECMRFDPSLKVMSVVTAAMKHDMDTYFNQNHGQSH